MWLLERMRCRVRLKFSVILVVLVAVTILLIILEDKWETYDPLGYGLASVHWRENDDDYLEKTPDQKPGDKIIVIPAMESDDTSWVAEDLPDWQRAIYLVNPSTASQRANQLTTPVNKGHEAMAYLTYIIEHYDGTIPSIVAFLHSHQSGFFKGWHIDNPLHDNVVAMKNLQLEHVRRNGFVNLRCNWNPGCKNRRRPNSHIDVQTWDAIFASTSTPTFRPGTEYPAAIKENHTISSSGAIQKKPLEIWATCCAQFAVSKKQIYNRPLADYVKIRQWLIDTDKDDAHSGRILEFLWHVIFGKGSNHCPDQKTCYCQVYGRC